MGKHSVPPGGPKGPDEVGYDVGYRKPPKGSQFKKASQATRPDARSLPPTPVRPWPGP